MLEHQLKTRGIRDGRILGAFLRVPRHAFVPESLRHRAYRDGPLPIGQNQTISQPYMVAMMTQLAKLEVGGRILEVGTGSGYQTAILAELGANVYSIECLAELSERAQRTLRRLGHTSVHYRVADGSIGWKEEAPFEAIIVAAGAPGIPQPLLDQLADGGRLIIPITEGYSQILYCIQRLGKCFVKKKGERCTFVPLVGKHGWRDSSQTTGR